jgi:hypothetical protein
MMENGGKSFIAQTPIIKSNVFEANVKRTVDLVSVARYNNN